MLLGLKKYQIALLFLALAVVFLLVYSPHFNYPFPYHVDEWHHIDSTKKIMSKGIDNGINLELGFHLFLLPLAFLTDLVLIYKFLPALWAVFSALALFFVSYKKTEDNFWIGFLAVIFFASLKSNVNLLGLWFFTPLTFSLPFIFLYIYFFSEGLAKENKKYILAALAIMFFLLPIHAVSVLFALPFLFIYSLLNYRYLIKEYKFFSSFLLIPAAGAFFYQYSFGINTSELFGHLLNNLQFKHGWGVLELKNSLTELYSFLGYILAAAGAIFILEKKEFKKYAVYILWPVWLAILIIIFRFTGVSYLSPFQRNLYYLVMALPFLSAVGLYLIIKAVGEQLLDKELKILIATTVVFLSFVLVFQNYYTIPYQVDLYKVIDEDDYQALLFLSTLPKSGKVMADPFIATAVRPVSGHGSLASLFFNTDQGVRQSVELFFLTKDCGIWDIILSRIKIGTRISYVLSKDMIDCGWDLAAERNNYYIYKTDE